MDPYAVLVRGGIGYHPDRQPDCQPHGQARGASQSFQAIHTMNLQEYDKTSIYL
jgi:hypothetical protein